MTAYDWQSLVYLLPLILILLIGIYVLRMALTCIGIRKMPSAWFFILSVAVTFLLLDLVWTVIRVFK